jgi:hypothetical protein
VMRALCLSKARSASVWTLMTESARKTSFKSSVPVRLCSVEPLPALLNDFLTILDQSANQKAA